MSSQSNSPTMPLGKDKARLQITVSTEEKEIIEKLAEQDDRTASNFVGRILKNWLKENGHISG